MFHIICCLQWASLVCCLHVAQCSLHCFLSLAGPAGCKLHNLNYCYRILCFVNRCSHFGSVFVLLPVYDALGIVCVLFLGLLFARHRFLFVGSLTENVLSVRVPCFCSCITDRLKSDTYIKRIASSFVFVLVL